MGVEVTQKYKEATERLLHYITDIQDDLGKAMKGNKAAAQRARTNTIKFSNAAKVFRKESIANAKTGIKRAERAERAERAKRAPIKKKASARKKKK
ncbi:MAG: histone [Chlamydiales bacterium]|jgi:hypothetical protein|nr:histone [Chlamydiales bacterium]